MINLMSLIFFEVFMAHYDEIMRFLLTRCKKGRSLVKCYW